MALVVHTGVAEVCSMGDSCSHSLPGVVDCTMKPSALTTTILQGQTHDQLGSQVFLLLTA
ncbi:hypothetical protein E2C01_040054 [Portunus trituberculatus]|uniref:Uncharacterized protein n=1 Tax=Portunus trituberculatus TaxID=210409 RepID=A0A5B7FLX8_PORTR|nr:hypothetical protein [Portunus trituberculatus]